MPVRRRLFGDDSRRNVGALIMPENKRGDYLARKRILGVVIDRDFSAEQDPASEFEQNKNSLIVEFRYAEVILVLADRHIHLLCLGDLLDIEDHVPYFGRFFISLLFCVALHGVL